MTLEPLPEPLERVGHLEYGAEEVAIPVWYCRCKPSVHGRFYCGICGEAAIRGEAIFTNPYAEGPGDAAA